MVAKRAQARDMGLLAWLAVGVALLVALGISRLAGRSPGHYPNRRSLDWPPEYFVVTNLRRVLERYPRVARTRDYVIYDLKS